MGLQQRIAVRSGSQYKDVIVSSMYNNLNIEIIMDDICSYCIW